MTHRLTNNYAKNYCNRTLIVKVIIENVVTCFLGTQCSNKQCCCTGTGTGTWSVLKYNCWLLVLVLVLVRKYLLPR